MTFLQSFVAVMPLVISGDVGPAHAEILLREEPRKYVVIERPGRSPVVVLGSDDVLAREDLKGTWQVVKMEHEGEPRPDLAADLQMRFSRGKLELLQWGRPPITVAYDVKVKHYPYHFSWTYRSFGRILIQKGVYWVEGDILLLCLGPINTRRATEFLTQPYDGRTMFVLERVEPEGER
jgi:uncharacterized protein (TIGR03067 family)